MAITGDQTWAVRVIEHPALIHFNNEFGTGSDLSRYENIRSNIRVASSITDLLNQLQMDSYIPTRTALLLKNNLHDIPFIIHTTRSTLYELKQNGKIGDGCFNFLHEKLNGKDFLSVYRYLYIIMLYSKLAHTHNAQAADPVFRFESAALYSDKLVKFPSHNVAKEEKSLQDQSRRQFLKNYLTEVARQANCPREAQQQIFTTIHALEQFNPQQFRTQFMALLGKLEQSSELEKICWKELWLNLSPFQGQEFFNQAYLLLKTEHYYKNCLSRVVALRESLARTGSQELLTLTEKCKKAYNGCIYLLGDSKNMAACSPMRFAALTGKMRSEWQSINSVFNRAQQEHSHHLCACQVQTPPNQNKLASWPFNTHTLVDLKPAQPITPLQLPQRGISEREFEENQKKTVAIIGCKWGGGHMEVSRGVANSLTSHGYHPVTVDLPEVLISLDPIRNFSLTRWLGKNWSIAGVFESLLKARAFAFINFLRWAKLKLFSPLGYSEKELKLVMEHLLKLNPDSVITTYSAHNESVIQACKLLGIPCIHINTDVDTSIQTRKKPSEFNHFKMAIPFNTPEAINPILTTTTPEQRCVTGPPVRHAFTLPRTPEDVRRFKEKWGIDTSKKVVVISNGKNGAISPYAKMLAKKYAKTDPRDIPIHLVVICGRDNQNFQRHLEQHVAPKTKLPMTVDLFYDEEKMEELMSMAAYGGALVGKAGGGTIFEAFTRGTRLLVDNVHSGWISQGFKHFIVSNLETVLRWAGFPRQLPWEKINMDFAKKHALAESFRKEKEFLPKLKRMLNNDNRPVQLNIEVKNVEQEIPRLLRQMLARAETEPDTRRARQVHRNL
jgi:UDP-N-acetylglucosamine:LPS N-acetylglucosamine transferase